MGDVTQIGPRPDVIFVCNCGCSTWRLLQDGAIECAACDNRSTTTGSWYTVQPEAKEFGGEPFCDVQGNGSIQFARSRVERMSGDADVRMIAIARANGSVHLWSDAETKKQVKWTVRRFKEAADLLKKRMR